MKNYYVEYFDMYYTQIHGEWYFWSDDHWERSSFNDYGLTGKPWGELEAVEFYPVLNIKTGL